MYTNCLNICQWAKCWQGQFPLFIRKKIWQLWYLIVHLLETGLKLPHKLGEIVWKCHQNCTIYEIPRKVKKVKSLTWVMMSTSLVAGLVATAVWGLWPRFKIPRWPVPALACVSQSCFLNFAVNRNRHSRKSIRFEISWSGMQWRSRIHIIRKLVDEDR